MNAASGIHAHPVRKLGCAPLDEWNYRRALSFGAHLATVPSHPISADDTTGLVFNMDLNDQVGDCVVAGWDHFRQIVTTLLTGAGATFTTEEIVAFYRTQNPDFDLNGSPATNGPESSADQGMVIQDFLEYLQQNGYILGFAKVDHTQPDEVRAAAYLGLGLIGGYDLQVAQQTQSVFSYVPGSGEWGGHCMVEAASYDKTRTGDVTWGTVQQTDASFLTEACSELWFVILKEHVAHPAFRAGFDLTSFAAAFEALTGRPFPADPEPPAPDPVQPVPSDPFDTVIAMLRKVWAPFDAWLKRHGIA